MGLPMLVAASKQDVPDRSSPGEAGPRQPLKLLDPRRGVVDVLL